MSSPKLTSSELNSVSASRSKSHCRAAPSTNMAGTVTTSVSNGIDAPRRGELEGEVGADQDHAEVRQVDDAQHSHVTDSPMAISGIEPTDQRAA
jgi:hypothetical protein